MAVEPENTSSNKSEEANWDINDDFKLICMVYTQIFPRCKGWPPCNLIVIFTHFQLCLSDATNIFI